MEVFPQLKVICRFQSLPIWGEALILYVGCAAGQSPELKRLQIFSVPAVSLLWQLPAHWGLFPGCTPPSPQDSCNRLRPPHYCWVSSLCCRLNYLIVSNWRRELQQMLNVSSTLDISTPSISPNLATVLCHCYPSCVLRLRHSSPLRVGLKHNSEYLWALPVSSSSPSCLKIDARHRYKTNAHTAHSLMTFMSWADHNKKQKDKMAKMAKSWKVEVVNFAYFIF